MGYLANFMVYTLAMIGVIAIALLVFKNSVSFGSGSKSKSLKVLDTLSLAPRKTLYVVSTGNEKFLIAGDVGQTTLISKLNAENKVEQSAAYSFKETMENLPKSKYMDTSNIGIKASQTTPYTSVMRNLAVKMGNGR